MIRDPQTNQKLAAAITRAASKQTYYTIRLLVDRDRIANAFRAYAYFRWVDDWLDLASRTKEGRIDFVNHQKSLMNACYHSQSPTNLTDEETMLVDLIQGDQGKNSGLQSYVRNMMAVMIFDAERRGQVVSQAALVEYSRLLATAVTEALHYFIGHDSTSPHNETRYLAATGAHLVHMLRDTVEDVAAGYYNIPREIVSAQGIAPWDITSQPYKKWVKSQVQLARSCFEAGKDYLAQVENVRCRIAGYAYIARFEGVLNSIESDDYLLRTEYPENKRLHVGAEMTWSAFTLAFGHHYDRAATHALPVR